MVQLKKGNGSKIYRVLSISLSARNDLRCYKHELKTCMILDLQLFFASQVFGLATFNICKSDVIICRIGLWQIDYLRRHSVQ